MYLSVIFTLMFAPLSLEYNASYLLTTCFTADDTDDRLDWGCTVNNGTIQCPKAEEEPAPHFTHCYMSVSYTSHVFSS